jgi:hypothetical protein
MEKTPTRKPSKMENVSYKKRCLSVQGRLLRDCTNTINPMLQIISSDTMSTDPSALQKPKSGTMASVLLPSRGRRSSTLQRDQVQWIGITPLEWLESLSAKTTEAKPPFFETKSPSPSMPSSGLGPSKQSPMVNTCETQKSTSPASLILLDTRRKRAAEEMTGTSVNSSSTTIARDENFLPHKMPLYWDFSFLERAPLVESIRFLVLTVESQPNFFKLKLPYERTRDHFAYSIGYIRTYDPNARVQLDKLYHETIHKLNALIDLSEKLEAEEKRRKESKGVSQELPCADMGEYLTDWLGKNFINPYPDETVLQKMARDCGTTPTVVSNWLINARTRKWRPAIMQAFDLNRPADVLLEDSINIFLGTPIRKLESHLLQASPTKRSRHA